MKSGTLQNVIAALLILLFVYAASSKLLDLRAFRGQMQNQIFSPAQAGVLIWLVPSAELLTALMLLSERFRLTGFYLSAGLLLLFSLYIGLALLKVFSRLPCSCGGVISSMSWGQHLLFNSFFLLLSFTGIYVTYRERRFTDSNSN